MTFPLDSPYRRLAASLDALPNRFPPAADESHLRLLAKLFTPAEADLAAELRPELESPADLAARLGREARETTAMLREMSKKGLVAMGKTSQGRLGFGLMPFVVGIYEAQSGQIDAELARLFEDYYLQAFGKALEIRPQLHRVIPVGESIPNTLEVQPFESVYSLLDGARAWGLLDCICRTQKALIGEACGHPVDVCLVLSDRPDAFSGSGPIRALTRSEAEQTLRRAANAGLVHCVSNNQRDLWYICNCCTCSCGILRGLVDLGIANVVARSAFVNQVDEERCAGCGECLAACMFEALDLNGTIHVNAVRCVGCGLCISVCPNSALSLRRREGEAPPPVSEADWRAARLQG